MSCSDDELLATEELPISDELLITDELLTWDELLICDELLIWDELLDWEELTLLDEELAEPPPPPQATSNPLHTNSTMRLIMIIEISRIDYLLLTQAESVTTT
jgi:hypothetical protein